MKEFEEWINTNEHPSINATKHALTENFRLVWQAASASSRTATLKELLEALPDDNALLDCYKTVWNGQNSPSFEEGFKGSSNYIRAIIEKKLESV